MTEQMYAWCQDLWRLPRSITGQGTAETLDYLAQLIPGLEIRAIPSGTEAFGWTVPQEWNVTDAYIETLDGKRLIDWRENNLHVVGYSEPISKIMSRDDLEPHLHTCHTDPEAIPYLTSYYKSRWGFCLSQKQKDALGHGPLAVHINSKLSDGWLRYGELIVPGETSQEILLSTYICHPSMANDNLSGIVVTTALARWLLQMPNRRYTYRILFLPETIGAICYLSQHLEEMQKNTVAGFVLSCCGDRMNWTYLSSREENTLADKVAMHALGGKSWDYIDFSQRGSDERQWCLAGLPVCLVMRSGFGGYPEYHTSRDDLTVISQRGLEESLELHQEMICMLESNYKYKTTLPCEPFLSQYGLYPDDPVSVRSVPDIIKVLGECDGKTDLIDLCRNTGVSSSSAIHILSQLLDRGLIVRVE